MLGKRFRELRKSQYKSINEVAKGITSYSSLRRWESGEGEMSLSKAIALLKRINISPKEYMDIIGENDKDFIESKINKYYEDNDIASLKEIADVLLNDTNEFPSNQSHWFWCAMACNFYMDLTGINIFPQQEIMRLSLYFKPIENWTQRNVLLFGNTQVLLPQQDIYGTAKSICNFISKQKSTRTFYVMTINALLNSVFILLKKSEKNKAQKILNRIEKMDIPTSFTNEKIRISFMKALLKYIDWHDSTSVETIVRNLYSLGFKTKANDYTFAFKQIKEIYY